MTEQPREPDDLFGLRPEEFTAARNALVKRLKSQGLTEKAADVQALKRPALTAWAVNQVARERTELIDAVIDAGAQLRAAMESTIAGDRSGLRAAETRERSAIQDVVDAASSLMEAGGNRVSEIARQRMTETLRAATIDSSVAEKLRKGVLETDMASPGFGLESIPNDAFSRSPSSRSTEDSRGRDQEVRLAQSRREMDEADRRLRDVLAAAEDAEERATRLRNEVKEAEKRFEAAKKRFEAESLEAPGRA